MTHAAPTRAAFRAIDIASALKESLTNSQIVKARFQSAKLLQWHFLGNSDRPLDAVAHSATDFTGNASHREQPDAHRPYRYGERGRKRHCTSQLKPRWCPKYR